LFILTVTGAMVADVLGVSASTGRRRLAALRKVKSEAKTSQKTPILSVALAVAADRPEYAEAIEAGRAAYLARNGRPFKSGASPL